MAQSIPFDTHAYVKKLRSVGIPEAQAEVHAEAFAELINDQLATKRDLAELEARLSAQIKDLDLRLTAQNKELELRIGAHLKEFELRLNQQELRIVVKLGAVVVAAIGALAVSMRYLVG